MTKCWLHCQVRSDQTTVRTKKGFILLRTWSKGLPKENCHARSFYVVRKGSPEEQRKQQYPRLGGYVGPRTERSHQSALSSHHAVLTRNRESRLLHQRKASISYVLDQNTGMMRRDTDKVLAFFKNLEAQHDERCNAS